MSSQKCRSFAHSARAGPHSNIQHVVHNWPLSDFHLFATLQEFLGGRRFESDEVTAGVKAWLNELAAEGCDVGIQRLVTGCDKCLNVGGSSY